MEGVYHNFVRKQQKSVCFLAYLQVAHLSGLHPALFHPIMVNNKIQFVGAADKPFFGGRTAPRI